MTMTQDQLSVQVERLRSLLSMLAFAGDRKRHDELIEKTRSAIASVRTSRAALANRDSRRGPNDPA